MAHKAKWDRISSMVSSSLRGSPICSRHSAQHNHWQEQMCQSRCSTACPCRRHESLSLCCQQCRGGTLPARPAMQCKCTCPACQVSGLSLVFMTAHHTSHHEAKGL